MQDELERELEDRYDNYGSLSRLYRIEIDAPLLDDLCDSPVVEPTGDTLFDTGYQGIRSYLDAVTDRAKAKSELAGDYCWIFIGYGADPNDDEGSEAVNAAYPYESVYSGRGKTLTNKGAEEVTAIFHENGFRPTRYRIAADDHIACELEFLQYLVGQEILAAREGDASKASSIRSIERGFIDNHLLPWFDKFQELVEARAQTQFYSSLGHMTRAWLRMDRQQLDRDEVIDHV